MTDVKRAIVTDECRINRGDEAAVDEALRRLKEEALICFENWRGKNGIQWHFVLMMEGPPR